MEKMPLQDILNNIHETIAGSSGGVSNDVMYDSVWDGTADTAWYSSNPTATAYTLSTARELAGLAQLVNNGTSNFAGVDFKLAGNLNLNNRQWTPIGFYNGTDNTNCFQGNFDGDDYVIGNLKIEGDIQYAGLFGYQYNGNGGETMWIKNLHLKGVKININSSSSANAGGIVGYQSGGGNQTIAFCYFVGTITATGSTIYKGTICGQVGSNSTITSSYYNSTIISSTSGFTVVNGTGATTAQMLTRSTYLNWNFSLVWLMNAYDSRYPRLKTFALNRVPLIKGIRSKIGTIYRIWTSQ